jgi:lipopolysaccharide/colanic/teichoic acid biosynthesis glycosyltransferase
MKSEAHAVALASEHSVISPCPLWKRLLDVGCIILALPLLLPLVLAIALLIKCVSRGPILFKQMRVGYQGRQFLCFKFRTMHVNAGHNDHAQYCKQLIQDQKPMLKMDDLGDPRLIAGAPFIRATGLDELPQLYNVVRGEMSLVGPRPCTPYEWESYLPWHKSRFATVPGLTGLWQVSGKNKTTFEQMMDLDIHYATHKSVWLDLKIIARTIPAIIAQVQESKRKTISPSVDPLFGGLTSPKSSDRIIH